MKPPGRCARRGDYAVRWIPYERAKDFVVRYHYAKGCCNTAIACFGLFSTTDGRLMGVVMFATPCSEAVRASVFGPHAKDSVTELHRLCLLDEAPHNSESMFIARALRKLKTYKPHLKAVVSFADITKGHVGLIYQATNALFYGYSKVRTFYEDQWGRQRHPRQCGRNIPVDEARARGWKTVRSGPKCRYLFLLARRKAKRLLRKCLRLAILPYPKIRGSVRAAQWRQVFHDNPTPMRQLDLALA